MLVKFVFLICCSGGNKPTPTKAALAAAFARLEPFGAAIKKVHQQSLLFQELAKSAAA